MTNPDNLPAKAVPLSEPTCIACFRRGRRTVPLREFLRVRLMAILALLTEMLDVVDESED